VHQIDVNAACIANHCKSTFEQHQGWGNEQFFCHVFAKMMMGHRCLCWKRDFSPRSTRSGATQQLQSEQETPGTNPAATQQQT